jgi:hypothetical protein
VRFQSSFRKLNTLEVAHVDVELLLFRSRPERSGFRSVENRTDRHS